MSDEIRVEVSIRNNRLMEAREALHLTQAEFARAAGISTHVLSQLERCGVLPLERVRPRECVFCGSALAPPAAKGLCAEHMDCTVEEIDEARGRFYEFGNGVWRWSKAARKLSDFCGLEVGYLFGDHILAVSRRSKRVFTLDGGDIDSALMHELCAPPEGQEVLAMKSRLPDDVEAALSKLTERERLVLTERWGLFGAEEKTLDSVGEMLGVTRERIRMIENRALRKLRHPSCSALLRDHV